MSIFKYTTQQLAEQVSNSLCWSDVCRGLNVTVCTFNYKRLQALCKDNNISTKHFDIKKTFKRNKHYWTAETLLTKTSSPYRTVVRDFLKRNNLLDDKCNICGMTSVWNNKPLRLELDHINGDSCDNRLENLRVLCPNCHSQTETFKKGKQS